MRIHRPGEKSYIKFLCYSPAGHGKTTLFGTASEDERTSPMAFLDIEAGDQSLTDWPDIDVFSISNEKDWKEARAHILGEGKYKSIAIDSISEASLAVLLELAEHSRGKADPDELAQRDYGINRVKLHRFLRTFRDIDCHLFLAAGVGEEMEAGTGKVTRPNLSGKLAEEIPALMDVVGYLAIDEDTTDENGEPSRVLLLHGHPKYRIKVRKGLSQIVPGELYNPTITSLLDTVMPHLSTAKNGSKPVTAKSITDAIESNKEVLTSSGINVPKDKK